MCDQQSTAGFMTLYTWSSLAAISYRAEVELQAQAWAQVPAQAQAVLALSVGTV